MQIFLSRRCLSLCVFLHNVFFLVGNVEELHLKKKFISECQKKTKYKNCYKKSHHLLSLQTFATGQNKLLRGMQNIKRVPILVFCVQVNFES